MKVKRKAVPVENKFIPFSLDIRFESWDELEIFYNRFVLLSGNRKGCEKPDELVKLIKYEIHSDFNLQNPYPF